MNSIIRFRWLWLALWIILLVVIQFTMPSMDDLVREKGQPELKGQFSSGIAVKLLTEFQKNDKGGKNVDTILVFNKTSAFNQKEKDVVEQKLKQLQQDSSLHIHSILSPFVNKDAEKRLISKDQKTIMAIASIEKKEQTIPQLREHLLHSMKLDGIKTYLTGNAYIQDDYANTSINGIQKTEIFTVIFIILVLILVFRSPVTPIISLIIVAITYLISQGTVGLLVEYFDFPFANTTQIFLILVLFGIGTDYNILLFMRYKEELGQGKALIPAIVETYKTAGKTVFFSGLAVFIGFSMLGFSHFTLYQSAVAVAIGVLFLLVALFTINPLFMTLLGRRLFWPLTNLSSHGESKLWSKLGHFSVLRKPTSFLLVIALSLPIVFFYKNQLSFDNLKEIGTDSPSVKGFEIVSNAFGAGQTLPTTVVIKSKTPMDSVETLSFLDQMHERLTHVKGVKAVYGPTRPNGEYIQQLYLNEQAKGLSSGIDQSSNGLGKISNGLSTTSEKISASTSGNLNDVHKLINGTDSVREGLDQVQSALVQINTGIKQGASGAGQLHLGLTNLENGLKQVTTSTKELQSGYTQLNTNLGKVTDGYQGLSSGLSNLNSQSSTMQTSVSSLEKNHPELATDADFSQIKNTSDNIHQAIPSLQQTLSQLNSSLASIQSNLAGANNGLKQIVNAETTLLNGATKLKNGANSLDNGLQQGVSGQSQVISSISPMGDGLFAINNGQKQILSGLSNFQSKMKELRNGLSQSADGLNQINSGLDKANGYLTEVTGSESSHGTFFVPEEVRKSGDFQKALDLYMSKDRKIVTWTIPLAVDPYSNNAMQVAHDIDSTIHETISNTLYKSLQVGTGGVSSSNYDLHSVSNKDFARTVVLMLAGIGVLLLFLYRSVWITTTILGTLVLAYYFSLTIAETIFTHFTDVSGLSWTIPFFSFIMIVALGVDYSIFVMMRYKEYQHLGRTAAILTAVERTGSVVISAAIILSGTFAAMFPSQVTTLIQIATIVIIGLLLLACVLLPMILPTSIALLDRISKSEQKTKPAKSQEFSKVELT